jgi:hypothetical protein
MKLSFTKAIASVVSDRPDTPRLTAKPPALSIMFILLKILWVKPEDSKNPAAPAHPFLYALKYDPSWHLSVMAGLVKNNAPCPPLVKYRIECAVLFLKCV